MIEYRRQMEERTERLRHDPDVKWERIRAFLSDQGVEPERAVLATIDDDGGVEAILIVVSNERMFLLDIDHPYDLGVVARWVDDVEVIRSWGFHPYMDIALEMVGEAEAE